MGKLSLFLILTTLFSNENFVYTERYNVTKYNVKLIKKKFVKNDLFGSYGENNNEAGNFESFRKLSVDSNSTDSGSDCKTQIYVKNGIYSIPEIEVNKTNESGSNNFSNLTIGLIETNQHSSQLNDSLGEKIENSNLVKENNNIRKNKKNSILETTVNNSGRNNTDFDKNSTSKNIFSEKDIYMRDYAQNSDDFIDVFNAIEDANWTIYNGDYYIMEFSDYNTSVPIIKLINLSVGLYNKNADPNLAKGLISAIFGTRTFSELDSDKTTDLDTDYNGDNFGNGIFNLDDFINWDDFDIIDELPTLFRSLNNIIWL
ncbi:hypothetical protein RS030_81211 [Cryptosporidium xiaoi]|uniref:Uncharacterized protein n=1 Tax=Cryptosporidium xiaoi TaxID=659607 RepID=A0AAV9XSU9_9CRYT